MASAKDSSSSLVIECGVCADFADISKALVLDFGSQYSHLIVRRLREFNVYSELKRCDTSLVEIKLFRPKAIILSGGPSSVYETDAAHVVSEFWDYVEKEKIPLLGICYGLQEMVFALGGKVEKSAGKREYGHALMKLSPSSAKTNGNVDPLLHGLSSKCGSDVCRVWMSHGDSVTSLPSGFSVIAETDSTEFAAISNPARQMWGLQFHPEVAHTQHGVDMLENFIVKIAKMTQSWNMKLFAHREIERLRNIIGDHHVIGALSGGVDSTVAAALLNKAIGNRFHGFTIDNGLLRKHEAVEIVERLQSHIPGLNIQCIDASERFLSKLKGVKEPEQKRKIIGSCFIDEFENAAKGMKILLEGCFLLQGTLYPDIIESVSFKGPSHTIKTHHNVGGLPEHMKLKVLEPLRELFKDEVRALGEELSINKNSVWRHPFPGPGLGIRILGEVTKVRADLLREADAIFIEEIRKSGDYDKIGQAFVVLLPEAKSVGVMGDCRTYEMTAVIRAVSTGDYMTADWYRMDYDVLSRISNRIINEVSGINRVCYDVSSKPPATIEWE